MRFRLKITLCMLSLLSLLFGVGGSILISISFEASLERERESARETYQMLLNTLQVVNKIEAWKDSGDVSNILSELLTQNAASWSALRLSTSSDTLYARGASESLVAIEKSGIQAAYCLMSDVLLSGESHGLQLSGAFALGDETLYLEAVHDVTSVFEMRRLQEREYQKIYLCMVTVCALLTYSLAWLLTRPLEKLTRASRAIARGHLSSRAKVTTNDEIGVLSAEFDHMAAETEKNVQQLKEAMERQERFMGSFSHELKTPMASIIGYADLLRGRTLTPDEQAEAAHYIFSEGKRLANLSGKLLELFVAGRETPRLRGVSLPALIHKVVETQRPVLADANIDIRVQAQEGLCLLEPDLAGSLLVNLIDNARKAMDGDGRIGIAAEIIEDGCRIRVADSGKGMPPEALAHITEAFYRVEASRSREQGGAGLGLALCAKIVELHHGTMTFESNVDQGTRVTVELKGGKK